jgi:transcriptional regulator with XRE-family HTH domain
VADREPDPDRIATQQDFGRELSALKTRAGLTVRKVARVTGLPVSTVGDYFSGRHLPAEGRPDQLAGILRACGVADDDLVTRWTDALQRARRPPGRRPGHADAPYRGLARFEPEDSRWFFGREDVTDLISALADEDSPLPLVLIGASGAGKSSLLRAGLIPRLTSLVALIEPADAPLAALRAGVTGLQAGGDAGRPAIVVDQFETVFTQCHDEAERREFVSEICELAKSTLVIVAMRADFYGNALRYPGLAASLQARQIVLGAMSTEQVRRAITEPARLARLDVEEGLAGLLLHDLAPPEMAGADDAYEPGALPLLSHALLATWQHSRGGTLTIADYLASGRITDALTRTAEAAYGSLSPEEQELARRLFLRLVHVADDAPPTRATVRLGELRAWGDDTGAVLDRFVRDRLITVDAHAAQITHDALLAAWPRLRSWIDTGREGLLTSKRTQTGSKPARNAVRTTSGDRMPAA